MEEIDLCWLKNLDSSYKIITIGKANVYHVGGGTMQYGGNRKNYLNFRNSLVMLIKICRKNILFFNVFKAYL